MQWPQCGDGRRLAAAARLHGCAAGRRHPKPSQSGGSTKAIRSSAHVPESMTPRPPVGLGGGAWRRLARRRHSAAAIGSISFLSSTSFRLIPSAPEPRQNIDSSRQPATLRMGRFAPRAALLAGLLAAIVHCATAAYGKPGSKGLAVAAAAAAAAAAPTGMPLPTCSVPRRPVPPALLLLRLGPVAAAGVQRQAATVCRAGAVLWCWDAVGAGMSWVLGAAAQVPPPAAAPRHDQPRPCLRRPTMMRQPSSPRPPSCPCWTPRAATATAARCPAPGQRPGAAAAAALLCHPCPACTPHPPHSHSATWLLPQVHFHRVHPARVRAAGLHERARDRHPHRAPRGAAQRHRDRGSKDVAQPGGGSGVIGEALHAAGGRRGRHRGTHSKRHPTQLLTCALPALPSPLLQTARVPLEKVRGFRAPFLLHNKEQRAQLHAAGFAWDSSITATWAAGTIEPDGQHQTWPFTLDWGVPLVRWAAAVWAVHVCPSGSPRMPALACPTLLCHAMLGVMSAAPLPLPRRTARPAPAAAAPASGSRGCGSSPCGMCRWAGALAGGLSCGYWRSRRGRAGADPSLPLPASAEQ